MKGAWVALAGLGIVVACQLSLTVGALPTPVPVVLEALLSPDDSDAHAVVLQRVPRTLLGLLVGCALGACGALIQGWTRNPLADPGLLGVNAGATLAVTVGAGLLGFREPGQYVWWAVAGALGTTLLVLAVARSGRDGGTPVRFVLTGVAMEAILLGISSFIILGNLQVFQAVRFWGIGSLGGRDPAVVIAVLPFLLIGVVLAVVAATMLNATALGDELGSSLGVHPGATRGLCVAAVTLLAGSAVALAGPIAFVGLMVPHIVRRVVGADQRWLVLISFLVAPTLVLAADVGGRVVLPSGELPVGIGTAIMGGPVMVALARRQRLGAL
ncbi:Fe(3+)-siderophore ABC transporter permease [Arachnia propionica]|uniref:Fe(3+)-siderophore ABC transporter permease n=1 Tax=Arachnia propionica TaxID=1750 RepID=A0A3P1WY33_9ACTN|nr:Fe(3+)-siderophore ABC transporter permease [Arachnia propionica]